MSPALNTSSHIDRIENAIERLTEISSDLKSMISVQEAKINHQEKVTENLNLKFETRRDLMDEKLKDVYNTIRERDDKLLTEIKAIREEHNRHYNCLNEKFNTIQKYIWMAIGGGVAVGYGFSFIANYLKIMGH
jgi:chromosome segregation ATPase